MLRSKIANIRINGNIIDATIEVFGYRKKDQSPRWYYAGKLHDDTNIITVTHRLGDTNIIKCNDKSINYQAAREWLEIKELDMGTLVVDDYIHYDLLAILNNKNLSWSEKAEYMETLPSYCHRKYISLAERCLTKDEFSKFKKRVERPELKYFYGSDLESIAESAMADLGF